MTSTPRVLAAAIALGLSALVLPAAVPSAVRAAPAAQTGEGVGVVRGIDVKAHSLTLQHGPIAALGWPGMTMSFKVKPALSLSGLKLGQTVDFTLELVGGSAQVTRLRPR